MNIIKKSGYFIIWLLVITSLHQGCTTQSADYATENEKVKSILANLSVEEKVGQMTQVTIDMILKDNSTTEIDEKKLKVALVDKHVGSILNTKGHAYTLEQWHTIINRIQEVATKETGSKIPVLYGIDAIHGTTYTSGSTLFPHNIGMAATRNPELVKLGAQITAKETRASGIRWNFDPTLGIGREPLWSRFEETYGEDVHLVSTMANAAIIGYEADGLDKTTAVASCMKHFLGYSVPRSGKDRTPAYISDIQLREYFLPPFTAAVNAGTSTVMINSGEINGVPVHASKYYLQDILRNELNFKGLAVSDWEDIIRLHTRHKVADSPKEAVKMAVNAGVDMSMVPLEYSFYDLLVELAEEGEVSEARLDEAVGRILSLKIKLGLFDNPYVEEEAIANFGKPEYKEAALEAARESITLLKNKNNVLPLSKSEKVLLTGPAANEVTSLHSAWSYTWQGNDSQYYPKSTLTIKQAFENKIGKENVLSNSTGNFSDAENTNIQFIQNNASKASVIVLALGEPAYAEGPGGIHDLSLDAQQLDLVKAAKSTGKPVIALLAQGRPRIIHSATEEMDGILMLYRPGSQGANATADIVFGDYNPNGILPFTYPKYSGHTLTYDHKKTEQVSEFIPNTYGNEGFDVQWPFGYGLSYTQFTYENLSVSSTQLTEDTPLTISVDVKNTGERDGKISVELYIADDYASITPSVTKLRKFSKQNIKAGQSATVSFTITPQDLSFINAESKRVTEQGSFTIQLGGLEKTFEFNNTMTQ